MRGVWEWRGVQRPQPYYNILASVEGGGGAGGAGGAEGQFCSNLYLPSPPLPSDSGFFYF